jgi:hypothetical protein
MTLVVPALLYATTADAKSAWASVAREAWRDGTWDNVLEHLPLASIESNGAPIVVWNKDRVDHRTKWNKQWSSDESAWQVNWNLESAGEWYAESVAEPVRHLDLVLDGMQHLWFNLGLLEGDMSCLPFLHGHFDVSQPTEAVRAEVIRPIISHFLRSLPTIMPLEARIVIASNRWGLKYVSIASRLGWLLDLARYDAAIPASESVALFQSGSASQILERLVGHYV